MKNRKCKKHIVLSQPESNVNSSSNVVSPPRHDRCDMDSLARQDRSDVFSPPRQDRSDNQVLTVGTVAVTSNLETSSEDCVVVDEVENHNSQLSQEDIKNQKVFKSRWYSPEAYVLFIPELERNSENLQQKISQESYDQEIEIKQHLCKQLSLFRRAWLTDSGWKVLVHDNDEKICSTASQFLI